jgi:hypothetical protein
MSAGLNGKMLEGNGCVQFEVAIVCMKGFRNIMANLRLLSTLAEI